MFGFGLGLEPLRAAPKILQESRQRRQRSRFEIKAVRESVSTFTTPRGGSIGLIQLKSETIVIDSQYARTAQICLAELERRGAAPLKFLLNTHHHVDHASGNSVYRPKVEKIVAHKNVPQNLQRQAEEVKFEASLPDTTFDSEWTHKFGGEEIRMKHYGNAHTNGDSVITMCQANVAHVGDLVFREMHPYIDTSAGASIQNWARALERMVKDHSKETKYIVGHARPPLSVVGDSKMVYEFRDYLDAVWAEAEKLHQAGKPMEELEEVKLKRFEHFLSVSERLSLKRSLEVAYVELSRLAQSRPK